MYKIRRKVNINPCPELSVWAVLPKQKKAGQEASNPELPSPDKALVWESDPRTQEMGWRLVLESQVNPVDIIASCQKGDTEEYHRHRYAIGESRTHAVCPKRKIRISLHMWSRHCLISFVSAVIAV